MNQAIRSIDRSIRPRGASQRWSFSLHLLKPATTSSIASSGLTTTSSTSTSTTRRDFSIIFTALPVEVRSFHCSHFHHLLPVAGGLHRAQNYLSTTSAAATATTGLADSATTIIASSPSEQISLRQPSALQQANLTVLTPGHAIYILQRYAAKGKGNLIRQSDFIDMCHSARPGKLRDGSIIATALKEFKRNNKFILQKSGAQAAVEGMLRSKMPTWKVQDGKPRVKAALFVAEQILNEDTGLYFATETVLVDRVLEELYTGLMEMKERGYEVSVTMVDESDTTTEGGDTPSPPPPPPTLTPDYELMKDSLRVTQDLIQLLIKRKSRPEWNMKKRASRRYLKRLQIGGGPYRSTLRIATKIALLLGNSNVAQKNIIDPFDLAWWTKFVDEESLKFIEEARERERKAMLTSAEAAQVDNDEENESETSDEGDESNDDVDVDEEHLDEKETATDNDDEAEKDKKA